MKDKLNQFIDNLNGQFVEVSDRKSIYQCMDLAYLWVFALGYPKATIQNFYAYQVYTSPKAITREYFDLIPNTPDFVPQDGDVAVFDKTASNVAGHIGVALGDGTTKSFMDFEQNYPIGTNAVIRERDYNNPKLLGVLRPKKITWNIPFKFEEGTKVPIDGDWGEMEVQKIRSVLSDLKRNLVTCENKPPVVKEVVKEVPVTVEKIVEVEKEVIKEVRVEVIKKVLVNEPKDPIAKFLVSLAMKFERP